MKKATAAAMSVVMAASLNMPIVAVADEGEQEDPASQTTQVDPLEGESVPPVQEDEISVPDEAEDGSAPDAEDVASSVEPSTNSSSSSSADPEDTGSEEGQTTGVAMIGNKSYSTLADAIEAVPEDGTETAITLVDDAEVSAMTEIKSGQNVKLDLSGYTVQVKKYILVRGKLTVADETGKGAIVGKEGCSSYYVFRVNGKGSPTLVLESGALRSEEKTVVQCDTSVATFEMKDGLVESELPVKMSSGSTANIQGGSIRSSESDGTAIELAESDQPPQPKLIVGEDGSYKQPVIEGMIKTESSIDVGLIGGTIKGVTGHLSENSVLTSHFESDISAALPSGKTCVGQDEYYVVEEGIKNPVVEIVSSDGGATRSYASLASAMVYLQDGETLKLLKSVEVSEPLSIDRKISATIDLNDKTLTSTSDKAALIVGYPNVDLTVKNGSIVSDTTATEASIVGVYGLGQFTSRNCALTLTDVTLSTNNPDANAGLIVDGRNENDTVTLQNCTINVPDTVMGIYFPPAESTLNIVDTQINAGTGVGIKGGTLNISGNTSIEATGKPDTTPVGSSGGIQETGDAIYVEGDYTNRAISVNIVGGVFSSAQGKAINLAKDEGRTESIEPIKFAVSGGSFSSDVSEYLADGYRMVTKSEEGSGTETYAPFKQNVVSDGEREYMSLEEAIEKASDGATITLLENVTTDPLTITKSINLDLGGHTLTLDGEGDPDEVGLLFTAGASMITNGTIYDGRAGQRTTAVAATGGETSLSVDSTSVLIEIPKQKYDVYGMRVLDGASLTLGDGASIAEKKIDGREGYSYGVVVLGNSSEAVFNSASATNLTINDGASISSNAFAVSGNGRETQHNTNIVVNGGTLKSEIGCAIYHPQYGKLTVNGGTIQGVSGIEMRSGEIEVTDGTIIGGDGGLSVVQNGGGSTTDNAALAVMQHSTKLPIKVEIEGGQFKGSAAFVQENPMSNDDDAIDKITLSIEGGSFDGQVIAENFNGEGKGFISGGTFSNLGDGATLDELLTEGFKAESGSDGSVTVSAQYVAQVGGKPYETVQAAINAATSDASTVQLLANTVEGIVIPSGMTITLDLAGHTITNTGSERYGTIYNQGNLTIEDATGSGCVDNVTHGKASLYNEAGATATLKGGTFNRSKENGQSAENNGGNSYYTILNHGTMTVENGVVVRQGEGEGGRYSSLVENGWQDGTKNTEGTRSVMTIEGGTFSGGLNTIKNDDYGELTINGGTFENVAQAAVLNWNVATISGGTFESDQYIVLNGYLNGTMDQGKLTITGGTFEGRPGTDPISKMSQASSIGDVQVSGGTFSSSIKSDFVADGSLCMAPAGSDTTTYSVVFGSPVKDESGNEIEGVLTVQADMSDYQEEDSGEKVAPVASGKVFAGWYKDAACETAVSPGETLENAYAKFVSEDVLKVGFQIPVGASSEDVSTDLRMLSSVDCLDYQTVGFVVKIDDGREPIVTKSTTVYENVVASEGGAAVATNPEKVFHASSEYFFVHNLIHIPNSLFGTGITVVPYWVTHDGTEVLGGARIVVLNDLIEKAPSLM